MATSAKFPRTLRALPRWAGWSIGFAVALAVFIAMFDWNWFKGPIERRVQAATGREFDIGGEFDVDLGFTPRIRAHDVRFGNASWSENGDMAHVDRVEFRIALRPLLDGRIEVPYLSATKPTLLIERNREGRGNWVLDTPAKEPGKPITVLVGQLFIDAGTLRMLEPTFRTEVVLNVRSEARQRGQVRAPLVAYGKGKYRGSPFELALRVDSPLDLQNREQPYHVDAKISAGATRAHAQGALVGQLQLQDFALRFDMSGANLGDLYPLLGVAVPETPPYSLSGVLGRDGNTWSYRNFEGKIGDSDMRGEASFAFGKPQRLTANIVSKRLDFDDLATLIGAPPSTKPGETASQGQKEVAARVKAKGRVLPDSTFNLDKLRIMDADVKLKAEHIDAPKLPIEKMDVRLVLTNGVLKIDPLDFQAAGGKIAAHLNLDAREQQIRATLTGDVERLELSKMFPSAEITKQGAGKLSGAFALETRGNSVAEMLSGADGNIGLIMGPGHVSNLLVELAGLDVAESLKFLLDKDKQIPLRCAYADFKLDDGVMSTHALAFDTTDTVVFGEGKVSFRDEAIDMKLSPKPKDRSPLSVRVPLKIGGTFADPTFHPEAGPLALRGAAAAALYSIAPPAALLALIETGPGRNIDCGPAADKQS